MAQLVMQLRFEAAAPPHLAEEDGLELQHARNGQHDCWVVRHQAGAGQPSVTALLIELQKRLANGSAAPPGCVWSPLRRRRCCGCCVRRRRCCRRRCCYSRSVNVFVSVVMTPQHAVITIGHVPPPTHAGRTHPGYCAQRPRRGGAAAAARLPTLYLYQARIAQGPIMSMCGVARILGSHWHSSMHSLTPCPAANDAGLIHDNCAPCTGVAARSTC